MTENRVKAFHPALAALGLLLLALPVAAYGADTALDSLKGDTLRSYGLEAVKNKNWENGRKALEKWLKLEKPEHEALVSLGRAQLHLKDEKDAEKTFKEVLKLDKKSVPALEGLLEIYLIRDKKKDMLNYLKRLGEVDQSNPDLLYYQAMAADRFKLKEYAEDFFWETLEKLVRENPDNKLYLNTLCDSYIDDRFYERGVLFLNELIDMGRDDPELVFQLARIYTHTGDKDLARHMMHKIEELGIDKLPPRQRFLMARELFRLDDPVFGCEAYFSAARDMDDELADEAYKDLRDINTGEEKRQFEMTPSGKKGLFLISFWGRKDPTPTTEKNERLVEHYHRIDYVFDKFRSPLKPGYDDRGRIYIKHGEPDQKANLSGNWAVRENETWLYSKGRSQPLIYHFVEINNFYRMVYRLEEALVTDLSAEMARGGQNAESLYRSRGEINAKYDQIANELHNWQGGNFDVERQTTFMDLFADELILTELGFTEGETTETFEFKFEEEPMNFYYFPAALKGPDTLSSVGVYFALPTSEAKVPDPFGEVELPVELEVVFYNSWWDEVCRVKTDKTYRIPNFIAAKENLIPDLLTTEIKPGNYHLAVRMKQRDSNLMQIYKSNFFVHSYSSPDTMYISDLILALDIAPGSPPNKFNLRGYRITPIPSSSFKPNQPVYIYYELYNLKPDPEGQKHIKVEYLVSSTTTSLSLARKLIETLGRLIGTHEETGKVVTTFERDLETKGKVDPVYLSVDPTGYQPGTYNLMVTVTDTVSGQKTAKDVTFMISK